MVGKKAWIRIKCFSSTISWLETSALGNKVQLSLIQLVNCPNRQISKSQGQDLTLGKVLSAGKEIQRRRSRWPECLWTNQPFPQVTSLRRKGKFYQNYIENPAKTLVKPSLHSFKVLKDVCRFKVLWWYLWSNISFSAMKKGNKKRAGNSIIDAWGEEIVCWTK